MADGRLTEAHPPYALDPGRLWPNFYRGSSTIFSTLYDEIGRHPNALETVSNPGLCHNPSTLC